MNPFDSIFFHAVLNPRRPAIVYPDGIATFGMLAEAANKATANLLSMGFKNGDRIACEIRDPFMHFIVAMAISRIGAVGLALQTDMQVDLSFLGLAGSLVDRTARIPRPRQFVIDDSIYLQTSVDTVYARQIRGFDFKPADLWRISFSSGTVGRPKAVGFSAGMAERRLAVFTVGDTAAPARCLTMMGFSSPWGIGTALMTLRNGGIASFAPNPEQALDLITFYGISELIASPQQLASLVQVQLAQPRPVLSLKSITAGGARTPPDVLLNAQRLLTPGIQVHYGSSETGRVAAIGANVALEIPGAVGFPFPWIEVEIVREDGSICRSGEEGRVRISGETVITSYLDEPDSGPGKAYFYPGDLAVKEINGLLVVTGRTDNRINREGLKVAAEALEELIDADPHVVESCVCALNTVSGETIIIAGVVAKAGSTVEDIKASCASRIHAPMMPNDFVPIGMVPRGMLGKIERSAAKKLVSEAYTTT